MTQSAFHRFNELPQELQDAIWEFSWQPRAVRLYHHDACDTKSGLPSPSGLPASLLVNWTARQTTLRSYHHVCPYKDDHRPRGMCDPIYFHPRLDTFDIDRPDMVEYLPGLLHALRVRHVRLTREMSFDTNSPPYGSVRDPLPPHFVAALDAVLASPTVRTCTFFGLPYSPSLGINCAYRLCRASSLPPSAVRAVAEPPDGYRGALILNWEDKRNSYPNKWRFHEVRSTLARAGAVVLPASHCPRSWDTDEWVMLLIVDPGLPSELIWTMGMCCLFKRYYEEEAESSTSAENPTGNKQQSWVARLDEYRTEPLWIASGICVPDFGLDAQPLPYKPLDIVMTAEFGRPAEDYFEETTSCLALRSILCFVRYGKFASTMFWEEAFMQAVREAAEVEPERGWWPFDPNETAYGPPAPARGYQRWVAKFLWGKVAL